MNRAQGWWTALGLPAGAQATLEVRGRKSGRSRSVPIVVARLDGSEFLVSMLGPDSEWVKNIEAANGQAVIRKGRRRHVRLVPVPPAQRAPILREYVRVATSGRTHFPIGRDASLADFESIAERYPVFRIDSA